MDRSRRAFAWVVWIASGAGVWAAHMGSVSAAAGPKAAVPAAAAGVEGTGTDAPASAPASEPPSDSAAPVGVQAGTDAESPPPPPRPVPLKPGSEELRREIEARRLRLAQEPREPGYEPRFELIFEFGMGGGGTDLVTATSTAGDSETLAAGDGVDLALGTRVTPFWLAHVVGFGVGGSMGAKYWSIGGKGGEASMSKFLLLGLVHMLVEVDPKWLLVFQGGLEKDFGIGLTLNGADSGAPFESRLGYLIDVGALYAYSAPWSFGFSFRATIIDYAVQTTPISANSYGLTLAIHYGQ